MSDEEKYPHSIGHGWRPLVQDLLQDLERLQLSAIDQIKEKFGYLRVYARCGSSDAEVQEKFRKRILQAEEESAKICEKCGNLDGVYTDSFNGSWFKTLCKGCAELAAKEPKFSTWRGPKISHSELKVTTTWEQVERAFNGWREPPKK
jgi:hypothetical protein